MALNVLKVLINLRASFPFRRACSQAKFWCVCDWGQLFKDGVIYETNVVSLGLRAWNRPKQPKPRESRVDRVTFFVRISLRPVQRLWWSLFWHNFQGRDLFTVLPLDQLLPEPLPGLSCLVNETSRWRNQTANDFFVFYFPMNVSGVPIHSSWRKSPGHGP